MMLRIHDLQAHLLASGDTDVAQIVLPPEVWQGF